MFVEILKPIQETCNSSKLSKRLPMIDSPKKELSWWLDWLSFVQVEKLCSKAAMALAVVQSCTSTLFSCNNHLFNLWTVQPNSWGPWSGSFATPTVVFFLHHRCRCRRPGGSEAPSVRRPARDGGSQSPVSCSWNGNNETNGWSGDVLYFVGNQKTDFDCHNDFF